MQSSREDLSLGHSRRLVARLPGLRTWVKLGAALIVAVLGFMWTLMLVTPGSVSGLAREDGPIEWIGAVTFAAGGFLLLGFGLRHREWGHRLSATAGTCALALVFLLAAGEEISWGQRVFGWETPEPVAARNVQQETNMHNLELFACFQGCEGGLLQRSASGIPVFDLQRLFTAGILLLLAGLPLACAWVPRCRQLASALGIPRSPARLGILAVSVFASSRAAIALDPPTAWAARELMEASWGLLVLAFAVAVIGRYALESSRPGAQDVHPA